MIDLRYLSLTLIGVFLALAIGLMTGSALGSPDRRDAAYEGLRRQFDLLRTENQRVQDENDVARRRLASREQAARSLLPIAVAQRLPGQRIGIILCGAWDQQPFWGDLETALRLAGAEIGPVIRIPDALRPLSPESRERLGARWEGEALSAEAPPFEAAGWVVTALSRAGPRRALDDLARETSIEVRGDLGAPVRRLLVLTSVPNENRAAQVAAGDVPEVRVVDVARRLDMRVVAAEPEDSLTSAVEPLSRRGLPVVDNIDTASGQIAAVLALAGADGHFGSKPGATGALPALEPR